jgi:hypothetical protein
MKLYFVIREAHKYEQAVARRDRPKDENTESDANRAYNADGSVNHLRKNRGALIAGSKLGYGGHGRSGKFACCAFVSPAISSCAAYVDF